jgi:hypothetical protein
MSITGMTSPIVIWSNNYFEGKCVIRGPEDVADNYELTEGISRMAGWPASAVCRMSAEYPKDIELSDNLYGTDLIVISARVKKVLDGERVHEVEYLPVQIINHKRKVASTDYYIVNPPSTIDCIDLDASEVTWNKIEPDMINRCRRLVIDPARVPASLQVFRPMHAPYLVLLRSSLAERLKDARLSGLRFREPLAYRGA